MSRIDGSRSRQLALYARMQSLQQDLTVKQQAPQQNNPQDIATQTQKPALQQPMNNSFESLGASETQQARELLASAETGPKDGLQRSLSLDTVNQESNELAGSGAAHVGHQSAPRSVRRPFAEEALGKGCDKPPPSS